MIGRCLLCGKESQLDEKEICRQCEEQIAEEEIAEEETGFTPPQQSFRMQNQYYYVPVKSTSDKQATAGFVLGLVSIIAWRIPLFGFPVTIVGLIMSILGMNSSKKNFAIAGMVCSIIFLVLTIINSVLGFIDGAIIGRRLFQNMR